MDHTSKMWHDAFVAEGMEELDIDRIISGYPSPLAYQFREIFIKQDAVSFCNAALKFYETFLINAAFSFLAYYIELVEQDAENTDCDRKLNMYILDKIKRISYGDMIGFIREVGNCLKGAGRLDMFEPLYSVVSRKKSYEYLQYLGKKRNDAAHGRLILTENNVVTRGRPIVTRLVGLLNELYFLADFKMVVPIEKLKGERYSMLLFRGAFTHPSYYVSGPISRELELSSVYLMSEGERTVISLDPFWKYTISPESGEKSLFFCYLTDKDVASLTDPATGEVFMSDEIGRVYEERMRTLLPDYKYQRNPYYKGFEMCIKKFANSLTIHNLEGDVSTYQELSLIKIKDEYGSKESGEQDYIHFDYHDAPLYPIIDEVFDLHAISSKGEELPVEYDIHNEGFRDFSIGMGRTLELEEEETIRVSFFEPMLFDGILTRSRDYYEINFTEPMDEMEFYMFLPSGVEVLSFTLRYMGNGGEPVEKKVVKAQKIIKDKEGSDTIYFKLKKPPVGKTILLDFNLKVPDLEEPSESDVKDKFRTGLFVHSKIKESEAVKWIVKEKEDGSIELRPVVEDKERDENE